MKHNQTRSRVGDPLCSALPHRSARRILSPRSGCALGSRCVETPGGNAARTFFFFTSYQPGREVSVMHSSGRQKGWGQPVCSSSCPINTFFYSLSFTSPLSSDLCLQLTSNTGATYVTEGGMRWLWAEERQSMRPGTDKYVFSHFARQRDLGRSQTVGLSLFLCADLLHARGWGLRNVPLQWIREEHMRVSQSGPNICTST